MGVCSIKYTRVCYGLSTAQLSPNLSGTTSVPCGYRSCCSCLANVAQSLWHVR